MVGLEFRAVRPNKLAFPCYYEVHPIQREHVIEILERRLNYLNHFSSLHNVHLLLRRNQQLLRFVVYANLSNVFFYFNVIDFAVVCNSKDLYVVRLSRNDEFIIKLIPNKLSWFGLYFECRYFY
jgi:hypothetical protein